VPEGQLLTISLLFRLLGFRSEPQVCFLLLFPFLFRAPCCHSLHLGLTSPITVFVILLTITQVFCVLIMLKIPSLWLSTINLFWRSSYVCSCSSIFITRYTFLYVLTTIVMTSLPECLRSLLWYLILRVFVRLYKTRRSLRSARRHLLKLPKTLCLVKLAHRSLKLLILGCSLVTWSTLTIVLCFFLHFAAGMVSCYVQIFCWKCWVLFGLQRVFPTVGVL